MKSIKFFLFSALLISGFVITALFPITTASAQEVRSVGTPTVKSPRGTIVDRTPTYKWSRVAGATKFEFQVWKGVTKIIDKTVLSSVCDATTCKSTPTVMLTMTNHKWRVRAYQGGVWSTWSPYKFFVISAPSFDSQFENMNGWARKGGGVWDIWVGKYLWTNGASAKFTSAYRTSGQFTDFDYSARLWTDSVNGFDLMVRQGSSLTDLDFWYPGYRFTYFNNGNYSIQVWNSGGSATVIQPATFTTAIAQNDWNTLRVVAKGNDFWFYINGTLVKSFSDNTLTRGYVGVMTYFGSNTSFVDWAKLDVILTPQSP